MRFLKWAIAGLMFATCTSAAFAQTKIKLGYTGSTDYVAAFLAREAGIFQAKGLDVELQLMTNNALSPAALISNSLQIGPPTPPVLLLARDAGMDIVYLAGGSVVSKSVANIGLVSRAGVPLKTPKDFEGKKVGIPGLGAILHITFRKWLSDGGVDPKNVTMIELAMPQIADVLKGGTIDAAVVTDPFLSRIVSTKIGDLVSYYMIETLPEGTMGVGFASTAAWAAANPAVVKAFREAIAEGAALAVKDPAAARAAIGKYIPVPADVLATMKISKLDPVVTESQIADWISMLSKQGMVKPGLAAAGALAK